MRQAQATLSECLHMSLDFCACTQAALLLLELPVKEQNDDTMVKAQPACHAGSGRYLPVNDFVCSLLMPSSEALCC